MPRGNATPFLWNDGLTIYFNSGRSGNADLYVAHRATVNDLFSDVQPIADLNTPSDETDPWLSPDGNTIFFTSNRSGTQGLWSATRQ